MNNSKHFVFVSLSIILVVALFIAMICSYFLPFGEEEAFAEVDSLQINLDYEFDLPISYLIDLASGNQDVSNGQYSYSGTLTNLDNSQVFSFDRVSLSMPTSSGITGRVVRFQFVNSSTQQLIRFSFNSSNSFTYLTDPSSFGPLSGSSRLVVRFSSLTKNATGNSSAYNYIDPILKSCLSVPVANYTPVFSIYSQDFPTTDSYLLALLGFNSSLSHYPAIFYQDSFDAICFTNYTDLFAGVVDPMPDLIFEYSFYFKKDDIWYHDFDTSYTIDLNYYGTFIPIFPCYFDFTSADNYNKTWFLKPVSFYYDGYSDYKYVFDDTGSTWLDNQFCGIANTNIADLDIYSSSYFAHANLVSYNSGYAEGMDSDQTLLSVIWSTFEMPFRLLFGTWNNDENAYVGGLFNFHILGVDIRAFVLGLMSACVVVAIIRFILGSKGS